MMQKMMSPVVDAASSQQQSQPVAPEGQEYLFTLTFPAGEIAILNVKHAPDQESARAIACTA